MTDHSWNKNTPAPGVGISDSDRKEISPFFWDVDLQKTDINASKKFIIERLLRFGRPQEVRWVLKRFSSDEIINVIKKSRVLDARTASYWAVHFAIDRKEIRCLNQQLTNPLFY